MHRPLKILIAEDNEQARTLLGNLLRKFFPDKNLVIFPTGALKTALQFAHTRGPFDLGLIDMELEDAKPNETADAMPQLRCKALIAMSGVASAEARKHIRRCGDAVDYIEKPIIAEFFIDKVARALGRQTDKNNPEADGDYAEVQIKAQRRLHERVTAGALENQPRTLSLFGDRFRFDSTIHLGHVVQIVLLIAACVGLYVNFATRFSLVESNVADLKQGARERTDLVVRLTDQLVKLDANQQVIAANLKMITDGFEFKPKTAPPPPKP